MQRQGLIAVNYPAREAGIGRHCNVTEAKKLCPELIAQHVATWREGDDKWAYRDDAAANIAKDKVSLDPYRLESRKILAVVKGALPPNLQKVEKASIDEVFLDLSAHVHRILLERFPELANLPPYDDPNENLPLPSTAALDWQVDALVDLEEEQESADPDWDDVAILVGSEIVRDVRARIRSELGYTCSAGMANSKLVSKLGSAFKKPNRQTVVRTRAVPTFLEGFKITKMRNLGGKLGEQVVSTFGTELVKELLDVSLEQMKHKLGDETGVWLYNTLRGIDASEVNARTQIKSMLSAKSFRPTINTTEQATRWLRIFVADIFARLVEEGVLENKRRPRTMNLHHRHAGQTHSRQSPIPQGRAISEPVLLELAKDLLGQIVAEGQVWPCANLSLSVGGFEDGVRGNMGIDAFLVKGEEAESLRSAGIDNRPPSTGPSEPATTTTTTTKKRRTDDGGLHRFFSKRLQPPPPPSAAGPTAAVDEEHVVDANNSNQEGDIRSFMRDDQMTAAGGGGAGTSTDQSETDMQAPITSHRCSRCNASFGDSEELQNHADWHMAKDLQGEERGSRTFAEPSSSSRSSNQKRRGTGKRGRGGGGKLEQGQSRLRFG